MTRHDLQRFFYLFLHGSINTQHTSIYEQNKRFLINFYRNKLLVMKLLLISIFDIFRYSRKNRIIE